VATLGKTRPPVNSLHQRAMRYWAGRELPVVEQAITLELVQWYVDAVEDDHPWYHGDSPCRRASVQ
jgi:hypothetical protein